MTRDNKILDIELDMVIFFLRIYEVNVILVYLFKNFVLQLVMLIAKNLTKLNPTDKGVIMLFDWDLHEGK